MPDRTPLRLVIDELGNPTGLAEFREGDTLPIGFVSGLGVELATIDALLQAVVVDKDLAAPPGSPANGSMYIVAAAATGAWSGQSGNLAVWLTTVAAWTFITPADGWSAWVTDEAVRYERVGGAWVLSTSALGLGTAATANLLGTVSQSAGVPTGAIIERGSNANGEYVRWADGTQICTSIAITTVVGTGNTITWPAGFVTNPGLGLNIMPSANWDFSAHGYGSIYVATVNCSVAGNSVVFFGVGRWF